MSFKTKFGSGLISRDTLPTKRVEILVERHGMQTGHRAKTCRDRYNSAGRQNNNIARTLPQPEFIQADAAGR